MSDSKLKLAESRPGLKLDLDPTEALIVFDGLKLMLRAITEPSANVPLDFVFRTSDLLRQMQPIVVEIAKANKPQEVEPSGEEVN